MGMNSLLPDKVCAGICLLGLTFHECSPERFSTSSSEWFNIIFSHIQHIDQTSDAPFVRVASWISLSALFTRLVGSPTADKDGKTLAKKLIQPVLKLLNEESSNPVFEEAICLFCRLINYFPSSVGGHYDGVEAAIFSRFMSENDDTDLLKKLGHCSVMLPKSRGDEESWSLMMQKVLLFLNDQLTLAFQGLKEEETSNYEVVRPLVPPGRNPLPPFGSPTALKEHSDLPVPVPVLIALAKRVLMVDGSFSPSSPYIELSLHVAAITRLLTEYLRTWSLASVPEIRIKAYSGLELLLHSMGMGFAIYVIEVVINNAFIDLGSSFHEKSSTCDAGFYEASEKTEQQPFGKKRKHAISTDSVEKRSRRGGMAVERSTNLTPISVRIAALKLLEALLNVAGGYRSGAWRPKVDNLLIEVATDACNWGSIYNKSVALCAEATPMRQKLQVASLRALKASLLSSPHFPPPHLPQSLEIFRKGTSKIGRKICKECSRALLALDVLMRPRVLSLVDCDDDVASDKLPEIDSPRGNDSFLIGAQGKQLSQPHSDDDLFERWTGHGETEVGFGKDTGTPYVTSGYLPPVGKLLPRDRPSEIGVDNLRPSGATAADVIGVDGDGLMVKSMADETHEQKGKMNYVEGQKIACYIGE
ncbi:OLC1v1038396C1 [Oldenlandia corymbosa var. corymbosa]|uniref:OLC1v1038396C1 n=1 Tax=Oldenlandia corymbosa var. corymbosa TaxID=529605 RepID=A0AAV1D0A5_OLDCO|nr:OLC1v1038396C1 [Oldenlandia corymbosa var. corymbosa]